VNGAVSLFRRMPFQNWMVFLVALATPALPCRFSKLHLTSLLLVRPSCVFSKKAVLLRRNRLAAHRRGSFSLQKQGEFLRRRYNGQEDLEEIIQLD
jgi:hypothetical protein